MKPLLVWIQQNPATVGYGMTTFATGVVKVYVQLTGREDQLGHLNSAIPPLIDLLLACIAGITAVMSILHATRGPALTAVSQAATIVAAIKGPPISEVVSEVKTLTEAVVSIEPKVPEGMHKF